MLENITALRVLDGVLQYLPSGGVWTDFPFELENTYLTLLTADELAAVNGASTPSASNVFATMNDSPSSDELAAISGAASPSGANVFATMSDIPSSELTSDQLAAVTGSTSPSSTNVFMTATDVALSTAAMSTAVIDWSSAYHFTKTLSENTQLVDSNLPVSPLVKNIFLTITSAAAETLTLPPYWKVISGTYDTSGVPNLLDVFCGDDTGAFQVDTITLTGTDGTATIDAAGGLTKTVTFNSDLTTSASDFVTTNAAAYLVENIVLTSDGVDLVFTSQYKGWPFTNPTITNVPGDLDGSVVNTTPNGTGTAQVDTVTLSGTDGKVTIESAGGLTKTALFNSDLSTTASDFVTTNAADYLAQGITLTSSTADLIFTATEAGTAFTNPTKTQIVGDLDGTVANTQVNVAAVQQVDTVTLTGTGGAALITGAGGLSNSVIFNTSLTQTATDFVTNQAADYAAVGITVTSSTADIIFTATSAGTAFTSPVITNDYGDLAGSVANTQANVVAVAQVDTVTITGTDGEASMQSAGGLTKEVRFNTSLTQTAADFVTNWAADYTAQAITVTSSNADIIFTANVAGTGFTNPTISNVPWDLDASVVNTQVNVAKVAQVDTITLDTGTSGKAAVTLAGGLTKVAEFDTSYAVTTAAFATDYAADYLAQNIIVTNSGDDIIFTAQTAGTGFTSPAIANQALTLDGSVVNTTVNAEPNVWCKIYKEA